MDPAYDAVSEVLRDSVAPVLDIGCGVGILAMVLREHGFAAPITGIDHDQRKVDIASRAANGQDGLSFQVADARKVEMSGTIVLLDVLHYFTDEEQSRILQNAAQSAGTIVIRDAIRDGSLRYRITYAEEALARLGGWLRVDRLNFPTREAIESPFERSFGEEVRPMFGRMPFNNYLFVFRRSSNGTMNE